MSDFFDIHEPGQAEGKDEYGRNLKNLRIDIGDREGAFYVEHKHGNWRVRTWDDDGEPMQFEMPGSVPVGDLETACAVSFESHETARERGFEAGKQAGERIARDEMQGQLRQLAGIEE